MKTTQYFFLALGLALFSACAEEENNDNDQNQDLPLSELEATTENSNGEMIQADLDGISLDVVATGESSFKRGSLSCATVTHDSTANPPRYILDFGPVNCLGPDGRERRGVVEVRYQGWYILPGSTITVVPISYFVNDFAVFGQRTTENLGVNTSGNLEWRINSNLQYVLPNGNDTVYWTSNRLHEFSQGMLTPSSSDNEFTITGTAQANTSWGISWNAQITDPLIWKNNCPWLSQGEMEITRTNLSPRLLDYGNGTCDNQATVQVGNRSRTITLR